MNEGLNVISIQVSHCRMLSKKEGDISGKHYVKKWSQYRALWNPIFHRNPPSAGVT
jgi:hypothetical protein